jgi:hypothetical protein
LGALNALGYYHYSLGIDGDIIVIECDVGPNMLRTLSIERAMFFLMDRIERDIQLMQDDWL